MDDPNSTLLPYILETLSRTPELCDTFENLCKNVHEQLIEEQNGRYANVRTAVQRALNVGQSLGIITLNNETIRVPFNFRKNKNYKFMNQCYDGSSFNVAMANTEVGGSASQVQPKQNPNQQKKDSTSKKKDDKNKAAKFLEQLENDDSDMSFDSVSSDRSPKERSRSVPRRRRIRNRSYIRPRKRSMSRGRRYVRRR